MKDFTLDLYGNFFSLKLSIQKISEKSAMTKPKTLQLAVLIGCLTAFSQSAISETFYKWVDENGTTHYGNKPSQTHQSTTVHTSGRPSGPASKMAPVEKPAPKTEQNPGEGTTVYDAEELAQYCKTMKERLDLMIAKNQIKQKNKDGSVVMLTEEQRQKQISDIKKNIADKCN